MSNTKLFALAATIFFTLALAAFAGGPQSPTGITVTCLSGSDATGCYEGFVEFTASGFPKHVTIVITDPTGAQQVYQSVSTTQGSFDFISQAYINGTWTVEAWDTRGRTDTLIDSQQFNIEPLP
jgi:hypothetical protein